jgi:DDE_Tnp_1-associated
MRPSLKHLSFQSLRHCLTLLFRDIPDRRQKSKVEHTIHDVVMSGFAMMYFQAPSLLQFQRWLREDRGSDNLSTIFKVETIPEDTQMRKVLDRVDPEQFRSGFKNYLHRLQRGKHLEQYRLLDGSYLCVTDGSGYFSSSELSCPGCLTKNHRNGTTTYQHQILMSAIAHPDLKQVLPLMPEEICNSDGAEKQDCEINAGKRFIRKLRKDHPNLKITLGWDGISSKQPLIEMAREERMNFLFVAKPTDHIIMMEWVAEQRKLGETKKKTVTDSQGRVHRYEWINQVPLNGNDDTVMVNFFHYEMVATNKKGERDVTYRNSWVTDFELNSQNIVDLVKAGRCRWKVENECFNTLKNQGYYIEHNYGHGNEHLSFNFLLLTLFAFYCHQIAELTDGLYQAIRKKCGSKRELWETVRSYIKIHIFDSMQMLFEFVLNPLAFQPTLIKPG